MKVLLVNGSPHEHGCTYTALSEVEGALRGEGIETGWFWIGNEPVRGCMGCRGCAGKGECVYDDAVNKLSRTAAEYDGFVFGSPVHFAGAAGGITSLMDRAFYSSRVSFAYKPAAAVVSARRMGTTAALEQMNKYFTLSSMPVVSSQYWNAVHGNTPEEVRQDLEGLQVMRTLGRNMAWLLRCIEAGRANGVEVPKPEPEHARTNFIR